MKLLRFTINYLTGCQATSSCAQRKVFLSGVEPGGHWALLAAFPHSWQDGNLKLLLRGGETLFSSFMTTVCPRPLCSRAAAHTYCLRSWTKHQAPSPRRHRIVRRRSTTLSKWSHNIITTSDDWHQSRHGLRGRLHKHWADTIEKIWVVPGVLCEHVLLN